MRFGMIITCTFLVGAPMGWGDQKASIKESVDRILKVASSKKYYSLSDEEKALIKDIAALGADALPDLAKLIVHPKREVTVVATEAFEEIAEELDAVDAKFLPAILHGLDNDHSGLPNVLEKIKTPEARAEFLSCYLKDRSSPGNQYQNGFRRGGADYLPEIIKVIRSDDGLNQQNIYLLGAALACFSDEDGKTAAVQLMKTFADEDAPLTRKRAILGLIGELGPPALKVEERLISIWETHQDLEDAAGEALVGIRSKKAGVILAKQLKANPDYLFLSDIAEVGLAAKDAGPGVADLLGHSDWDLRLGAARTLGFIGYNGADGRLIKLLDDPSDVRLNFVAAESLGRLKSKAAVKELKRTGKDHWHPHVRTAAVRAAGKIESNSNYELEYPGGNFPFEYFNFQYWGIESPEDLKLPIVEDPASLASHAEKDQDLPGSLAYSIEIVSYGAGDEEEQKAAKDWDGIIVVNPDNMVEKREKVSHTPVVGLRVSGGWLLGGDRGEWGGELVFKGDKQQSGKIFEENVEGLFRLGGRTIAVTGLAHLGLNDGMIYELNFVEGKWSASPWRALPGAPRRSGKLKNGEVMVATYGGGIIILSEDGGLRMADIAAKAGEANGDPFE